MLKGAMSVKGLLPKCPVLLFEPLSSAHPMLLHSGLHFGSLLPVFSIFD